MHMEKDLGQISLERLDFCFSWGIIILKTNKMTTRIGVSVISPHPKE